MNPTVKKLLKPIVKRIPLALTLNQRYDKWTFQIFRRVCRPDSSCVDVGCHEGEMLAAMIGCAPNGTHYAFEPLPHMYEELKRKFPKCIVHPIALSNEKGKASFNYVVSGPGFSGFRPHAYDRPDHEEQTLIVEKDRLDNVLPADARIDLIKVDVEGAELEVFEGAVETLRRCKPVVVFEHGIGGADAYGTRPEQVFDLFAGCGLHLSLLPDFLRRRPAMSREEFVRQFNEHLNYYFVAHPPHGGA